jgi:capsular polysaccharide biosynthesis protein
MTSPASFLYHDEETLLLDSNVMGDYLRNILPDKLRLNRLYVCNHSFFNKPVRPLLSIYTALAGIIGLMLTAGAAFLIEHLDDHIKSTEQVESILGLPVIGLITETVNFSSK